MAQSAAFQRFYDDGAMDVPASIPITLRAALFQTLRDFLQHTNIWVQDLTVNVVPNTLSYTLTVPSGTALKRLMNFYNSTDTITKAWFLPAQLQLPTTLLLARSVEQNYTMYATVALYTIDPVDADGNPIFPAWILDNYFDTLYSGMLWRMYAQPSKPWSNAGLAATRYKMYMKGRGEALAEVQRGNTFNTQNWVFPVAGTTRGRQHGV